MPREIHTSLTTRIQYILEVGEIDAFFIEATLIGASRIYAPTVMR